MTDNRNLPAEVRAEVRDAAREAHERGLNAALQVADPFAAARRPIEARIPESVPSWAYVVQGLGELPLSGRVRDAIRVMTEVLQPLVDSLEAQEPKVVTCFICNRNLGGWPPSVLHDHWFAHSPLQRWLASKRIR